MESYHYADLGNAIACTLCVDGRPIRRATVSKQAIAQWLARTRPELGWSVRGAFKKVGRGLNKVTGGVAKKIVKKVVKPVAKVWMKVEEAVRPIGKKIPIVGDFARLHEKVVAPVTRKVFGAKQHAKTIAKLGKAAPPALRREAATKLVSALHAEAAAKAVVLKATAKLARVEPKVLAKKQAKARKQAGMYLVIAPDGKRFKIPASAL